MNKTVMSQSEMPNFSKLKEINMLTLPRASEIVMRQVFNQAMSYVVTDIQEHLYEGEGSFEVDIAELDQQQRFVLMDYLEDLGYTVDQSYGEDVVLVSVEDV